MIQAQNLSKTYKEIKALDKVDLSVKRGEACGILGPNGAGKSTLFKILCGLVTPDSGKFVINSTKKKAIGGIIEKPAFYEYLSAKENLSVISVMQGAPKDNTTLSSLLEIVGLSVDRNDPVKNFSLGMKQRLGIAIALLNNPDCLILDEPFLGLDPLGMQSLRNMIKQFAHDYNLAILISSHLLDELSKTCDSLHIMNNGKIIQSGPTAQILNNSTNDYTICGPNLSDSQILQKQDKKIDGDCITIKLEVAKASFFIKSLIEEGIEITYFGPEKNLKELYKPK